MVEHYDVSIFTVRPGTHPRALAVPGERLSGDAASLACWYSEIGLVNQILLIRSIADPVAALDARLAAIQSNNPFGIAEFTVDVAMDTYVSFDFVPPMRPRAFGPCYEVRTYGRKPGGPAPTIELWRKAVPGRLMVSPLLAAMTSVSGAATHFMHIWPYKSYDERARLRDKAGRRWRLAAARRPQPSGLPASRYLPAGRVFAAAVISRSAAFIELATLLWECRPLTPQAT